MTSPVTDTAKALRRILHLLTMASMELEWLALDGRIRPESRAKFSRYQTKFIDWIVRDIRTDMKDSKAAMEVVGELTAEKAKDLQLLIDFVLQVDNIGDILNELQGAFDEQLKKAA